MSEPWTPGPWKYFGRTVWYVDGPPMGYECEFEKEADARLISLAPEMAELLEKLATWFETAPTYPPGWMGTKDVPENARQARDLLARARGEDG